MGRMGKKVGSHYTRFYEVNNKMSNVNCNHDSMDLIVSAGWLQFQPCRQFLKRASIVKPFTSKCMCFIVPTLKSCLWLPGDCEM